MNGDTKCIVNEQEVRQQPKICVVIRKRPISKKEIARNQQDVVEMKVGKEVIVREKKQKVDLTKYLQEHQFKFDSAFDQNCNNTSLYDECVRPIVKCAFLGARVTCFAYGQTGSGKTYTMNGDIDKGCPGLYYLGAEDIFNLRNSHYNEVEVAVSFYEIYCGRLYDLLNGREQLQAREDGKQNVNIIGLTVKRMEDIKQFMETIAFGSSARVTSQNSTNADSSRSHAILQISLMSGKKTCGKISFIDLAGCQRGADTIDQNKQTKIDGAEINKSLLALKQCIRALDQGKTHTPFRGSKLTMVLKDSFTGFCRTLMIGTVSPNSGSCQNTLNTLRYADRVKELKKGGNQRIFTNKEDQLTKQLMLPRNRNNRQIILKTSEDEQNQMSSQPKCQMTQSINLRSQASHQLVVQKNAARLQKSTTVNKITPIKEPFVIKQGEEIPFGQENFVKKKMPSAIAQGKLLSNTRKNILESKNAKKDDVENERRSISHHNHHSKQYNHPDMIKNKSHLQNDPRNRSAMNRALTMDIQNIENMQIQLAKVKYQKTKNQTRRASKTNRDINYSVNDAQSSNFCKKDQLYTKITQPKAKQNYECIQQGVRKKNTAPYLRLQLNKQIYHAANTASPSNSKLDNESFVGHESQQDHLSLKGVEERPILDQRDYQQWNLILQQFRCWTPNPNEVQGMSVKFQELVKFIIREQLQLSQLHKQALKTEQKSYKHCLALYQEVQEDDKNNEDMYDYAGRLSQHLLDRSNSLIKLRQKVQNYRRNLKEHEMCESKLVQAAEMAIPEQSPKGISLLKKSNLLQQYDDLQSATDYLNEQQCF